MSSEPSTDLLVVPEEERELRGLELAERHFPMERREQVASFLNIEADNVALLPYLAWCASLNLSPIAGHVWLIPSKQRIPSRDGEGTETVVKYRPAIGRDGLLHKARESKGKPGGYKGMSFDVVCERDTFEVERSIDPDEPPKVLHRYASKPTAFDDGEDPTRYRGRVIGAWACCYVDGEPPTFYYANLREHGKRQQVWAYNPAASKRKPVFIDAQGKRTFADTGKPLMEWAGAWDYTSTMVLKSAQSYVLRIGLGVTGVVPVDELRDSDQYSRGDGDETPGIAYMNIDDFDFEAIENEELRERLRTAVEAVNDLVPMSWTAAKCEMVFTGRSDAELTAIAEQIEHEGDVLAKKVDPPSSAAAASEPEAVGQEEEPPDADVVEDDPEKAEKIEALRHRAADLQAARDEAEPASEEASAYAAELDQVEAELRELGAEDGPPSE